MPTGPAEPPTAAAPANSNDSLTPWRRERNSPTGSGQLHKRGAYLHISFAGLALTLGPLQFARAVRRRYPVIHRWIGRCYLLAVGIGSVAAFVMSFFSSVALAGFFGFGTLALLWAFVSWRGYRSVRNADYPSHQAWMIRSFALTYAGVTLRAWFAVLVLIQLPFAAHPVDVDHVFSTAYVVLPFLSWLPNLVVAEWMIRRRGLPALTMTPSTPR